MTCTQNPSLLWLCYSNLETLCIFQAQCHSNILWTVCPDLQLYRESGPYPLVSCPPFDPCPGHWYHHQNCTFLCSSQNLHMSQILNHIWRHHSISNAGCLSQIPRRWKSTDGGMKHAIHVFLMVAGLVGNLRATISVWATWTLLGI